MNGFAYYNEIDPYAAQWLRNLIKAKLIAPGVVDERSVSDVKPAEIKEFTQCHFFAGIGVWSHALRAAGWNDDRPVWTGSCPCQPFSTAGKGNGFDDERHLWPHWFHLIEQCRPITVFGEQVASKDGLTWLDSVQTDLEATGYINAALDLCAAGFGAPHIRQRLWFVALRAKGTATPNARDWKDSAGMNMTRPDGKTRFDQLGRQVFLTHIPNTTSWPTPNANNWRGAYTDVEKIKARKDAGRQQNLQDMARLTDSGPIQNGSPAGTENIGQLNPALSRWLMALPKEWDDCAPMETPSSRKLRKGS